MTAYLCDYKGENNQNFCARQAIIICIVFQFNYVVTYGSTYPLGSVVMVMQLVAGTRASQNISFRGWHGIGT